MQIACLMMQKNETLLLKPWIEFHGHLFGFENLYIYDNGSTDLSVLADLGYYSKKGVNVDFSKSTRGYFNDKGEVLANKMRELDVTKNYEFYFPLDCDEFLGFSPFDGEFGDAGEMLNYLGYLKKSKTALSVENCYFNIPYRKDAYYIYPAKKTFFARNSVGRLDMGYHSGVSRYNENRVPTRIVYFHFHNKPFDALIEHAKLKLDGRVENFSAECLRAFDGAGKHLIDYFFMTEDNYKNIFPEDESCLYLPFIRNYLMKGKALISF